MASTVLLRKRKQIVSSFFRKGNEALKKKIADKSRSDAENFTPPRTKREQEAVLVEILNHAKTCISLASKVDNISLFINWYDEALDDLSKLMMLDKVNFKQSNEYYKLNGFKREFQLHLCDAIVRAKDTTISLINSRYKNSREFQKKALESFEADLNLARPRFSPDTAELANASIEEIRRLLGISDTVETELSTIDRMEGHQFEHWCADLLRKNGFSNVEVTPGSGDQGVDVLAIKGGIKYAIQCKCYSHNLDNAPVQEVHSGKDMPQYRCQIGVVMTNSHFTKGAVALAEATGTLLWDRDKLQEFIQTAGRPD